MMPGVSSSGLFDQFAACMFRGFQNGLAFSGEGFLVLDGGVERILRCAHSENRASHFAIEHIAPTISFGEHERCGEASLIGDGGMARFGEAFADGADGAIDRGKEFRVCAAFVETQQRESRKGEIIGAVIRSERAVGALVQAEPRSGGTQFGRLWRHSVIQQAEDRQSGCGGCHGEGSVFGRKGTIGGLGGKEPFDRGGGILATTRMDQRKEDE